METNFFLEIQKQLNGMINQKNFTTHKLQRNYDDELNFKNLTIRLDSLLAAVLALPKLLRTVNAAARCLKASVSGPPPAKSNSWRKRTMLAYVFPDPHAPDSIIACGQPVSPYEYNYKYI